MGRKYVKILGVGAITIAGLLQLTSYKAMRIIDGDTFETTNKQIVRINNIDAPENGACGSSEATQKLERLIMNKNLYMKVVLRDGFRLVANVYTINGAVAQQMIESGWAEYTGKTTDDSLRSARQKSKDEKIGIFDERCLQTQNPDNPKCVIKGNDKARSTNMNYRFPGCGQYDRTEVWTSFGDRWFCTEAEAQKAGFVKGKDCFGRTWK